jgi:hypothetical protein
MAVAGEDQVWDVGDVAVVRGSFYDTAGTLTDPTTITLKARDPSGNIATYTYAEATVTKDSTGVYSKNVTLDEAGKWTFGWTATGTVATSAVYTILVRSDPFA